MKAFLWLMLFEVATISIYGETPKELFQSSISSLEDASGSVDESVSFSRLESAWAQLPQGDKAAAWPQMSLAYVDESSKRLDAKDPAAAARYLALAGALNQSFGGRLEYATKSPDAFFDRLARLQTKITTRTGVDPLAGVVDYVFQKSGNQYIVARAELDPEVNGVTIDGVEESESLVQAHYLEAQGENVSSENTRWFIGPKGNVAETLRRANREVIQDQYGRYVTKPLQGSAFEKPDQAKQIAPAVQSTTTPPMTPQVKQAESTAPATLKSSPTAETKSSPWPMIVGTILLLAVAGGIFLKLRRK